MTPNPQITKRPARRGPQAQLECRFRGREGIDGRIAFFRNPPQWLGGRLVEDFSYAVSVGKKRLAGSLTSTSHVYGDFKVDVRRPGKGVDKARLVPGLAEATIEVDLSFNAEKSKIAVGTDGIVRLTGEMKMIEPDSRLIVLSEQSKSEALTTVAGSMPAGFRRAGNDQSLITAAKAFENLTVILWIHTPSMVPTATRLVQEIAKDTRARSLGIYLEEVNDGKLQRVKRDQVHNLQLSRTGDRGLRQIDTPVNDVLSKAIKDKVEGRRRAVRFETVDILLENEKGQAEAELFFRSQSAPLIQNHRSWTPTAEIEAAAARLENLRRSCTMREEEIVSYLRVKCADRGAADHNILFIGAAHEPMLAELPGAGVRRCLVAPELRRTIGSALADVINSSAYLSLPAVSGKANHGAMHSIFMNELRRELEWRLGNRGGEYATILSAAKALSHALSKNAIQSWWDRFPGLGSRAELESLTAELFNSAAIPESGSSRIFRRIGALLKKSQVTA